MKNKVSSLKSQIPNPKEYKSFLGTWCFFFCQLLYPVKLIWFIKRRIKNNRLIIIRSITCLIIYFTGQAAYCQLSKVDSLLSLLKKDKEDTSKVIHLNLLVREYIYIDSYDSAMHFANKALALCDKILNPKSLILNLKASSYNNVGIVYRVQGDYTKALENFLNALKMDEELKDKNGMAKRLGNIGIVYKQQGDYPKALDYYFKALKIGEELGDKNKIAIQLSNIGIVYAEQKDYPKALDYFFKALKMAEELGNKNIVADNLVNIGNVYVGQAASPLTPLQRREELQSKALNYYFKTLKMKEELRDKYGIAICIGNIGLLYTKSPSLPPPLGEEKKGWELAEVYLKRAIAIDDSIGALNDLRQLEESLSQLYDTTGRYQLALIHYKKAMALKDTIFNEEKDKELTRKEMNYEFEKKEAAAEYKRQEAAAVAEAESKKQKIVIWSVIAVLLLVVVFAVFIFCALRITQKQKKIIEQQKKVVEEKQNEILASIRYAKRIQDAILPTEKYIAKSLYRLKARMP